MTEVEALLAQRMAQLQSHVRGRWIGYEREAVIEFVRAADEAACVTQLGLPNHPVNPNSHYFILKGVTPALATLLPDMKKQDRGLPFAPSNLTLAANTDGMLAEFGRLATLQRLASLEHYGLARSRCIDAGTAEKSKAVAERPSEPLLNNQHTLSSPKKAMIFAKNIGPEGGCRTASFFGSKIQI